MADTKLGGVYYEVSAETEALLKAEQVIYKSTEAMTKDFNKVDKELQNLATTIASSGQTINKFGKVVDSAGNENKQLTETLGRLTAAHSKMGAVVQSSSSQFSTMSKVSAGVRSAFQLQKGSAQQLGFQLQDVAVQAQMGTSWFTILGQQGSQLASVMGPGGALFGAVIAISAAIGGVLVKALTAAESKVKELPEKLQERLDDIKASLKEVDEESKQAFTQVELGKINSEYNELGANIAKLQAANEKLAESAKNANDPRTAKLAEQALFANRRAIQENISKQSELALLQEKITREVILSKDGWTQYKDEAEKSIDITKQISQQIQVATEKVINGENAARRMALAFQLGLTNAEMLPAELQKALDVLESSEAAARREAEWRKDLLDEQRQVFADIEAERKAAHAEEVKRIRAEEAERKKLESVAGGNLGLTRLQQLAQQYEQEKALLLAAQDAKIASEIAYQDRLTQLEADYATARAAEIKRINDAQKSDTQKALEAAGFSYEQLSNQAIGTFAAIASGATSGKDAIRAMAQSILTQAIGALIKMAITAAAGQTAAAATGSATAATLATAYAPAAAAASLASFGANAAPAAAGITATYALTSGLSLAGGRLHGGPTSAGSIYPITENGRSEILQEGNKQYLLAGRNGNVVSNNEMQSGAATNIIVNVQNNTAGQVDVQRRQGADRTEIIDIVVADINNRGRVSRAITSTTTASNKI